MKCYESSPLTTDPTSKLHIFGHNCDPLSMNSTKICILEKANQIGLRRLLKGGDGAALEPQIGLEILSGFSN